MMRPWFWGLTQATMRRLEFNELYKPGLAKLYYKYVFPGDVTYQRYYVAVEEAEQDDLYGRKRKRRTR